MENGSVPGRDLHDLILVAGHAPFRAEVESVPERPELDDPWVLNAAFQLGEPPFYIEHIRRGVALAAQNPEALLLFSGGLTRQEAGDWTEAKTYHEIAKHFGCWIPDAYNQRGERENLLSRINEERYARDSYENLLFGISRFFQLTGRTPRMIVAVSWAFKAVRFDLHRQAIRFPSSRFRFDGFNEPLDLAGAWHGERKAIQSFLAHPHGTDGDLLEKRQARTFGERAHGYEELLGLEQHIKTLESLETRSLPAMLSVEW